MIDGVTKPFELGGVQLDADEKRSAAAAYVAGIAQLFERFDSQTGDTYEQVDFAVATNEGRDVISGNATRSGLLYLIAPDVQMHYYALDETGVIRRSDSRSMRAVTSQPDAERSVPKDAPSVDRLQAIKNGVAEKRALGISDQPVDTEEVRNLFALLAEAVLE